MDQHGNWQHTRPRHTSLNGDRIIPAQTSPGEAEEQLHLTDSAGEDVRANLVGGGVSSLHCGVGGGKL